MKKDKALTHLLFSSYTIGFVLGALTFFITDRVEDVQFSLSRGDIFSIPLIFPIVYWIYRYSGLAFNDQSLKVKLLYFVIWIGGMYGGLVFFEMILN